MAKKKSKGHEVQEDQPSEDEATQTAAVRGINPMKGDKEQRRTAPTDQAAATKGLGVSVDGTPEDGLTITQQGDAALCELFGTKSDELAATMALQCLRVLRRDEMSDENPTNDERLFMLATVKEIAPKDHVERMLAVQMAATHVATIRSARWLANTETIPQVQAHYTGFNKLARSFAMQVEALRKHRTGGKQTVTVQHVNVGDGGQAVVGNVQTGGG